MKTVLRLIGYMYWENVKDELQGAIEKPRLGLISDVDGTISPIVDVPDEALVTHQNLELLAELKALLTLIAVISGRSTEDVSKLVGLPGIIYIGNHGMEQWQDGKAIVSPTAMGYRTALSAAIPEIKQILIEGMRFEDKGATLSVHYRQTNDPESVRKSLASSMHGIAKEHGLFLTQGRMVFEFRPPVEIDKGTAFEELVRTHQLDAAFYLGDDTTDVTVFIAARRLRESNKCLTYGLGVESQGTPRGVLTEADYIVREVAGVESFLSWLLGVRMALST